MGSGGCSYLMFQRYFLSYNMFLNYVSQVWLAFCSVHYRSSFTSRFNTNRNAETNSIPAAVHIFHVSFLFYVADYSPLPAMLPTVWSMPPERKYCSMLKSGIKHEGREIKNYISFLSHLCWLKTGHTVWLVIHFEC